MGCGNFGKAHLCSLPPERSLYGRWKVLKACRTISIWLSRTNACKRSHTPNCEQSEAPSDITKKAMHTANGTRFATHEKIVQPDNGCFINKEHK